MAQTVTAASTTERVERPPRGTAAAGSLNGVGSGKFDVLGELGVLGDSVDSGGAEDTGFDTTTFA